MVQDQLENNAAAMLDSVGLGGESVKIEPLSSGGNNRVFKLFAGNTPFLLKWYFNDSIDTRDRLATEFRFLEHAWNLGLRCVPQPIAKAKDHHMALYEFIEGDKLESGDINEDLLEQAAKFLASLNSIKSRTSGNDLPIASEACFSLDAHISILNLRFERLSRIEKESLIDQQAYEFIRELEEFWSSVRIKLINESSQLGIKTELEIPIDERCLSPSDFGFHNSLLRSDGTLCFIDFEYAGWDDPAKAVGDFFSHPGVPITREYFDIFLNKFLESYPQKEIISIRVKLLEIIFQIKWCCIILNEFLPHQAKRRNFANPKQDSQERKNIQLTKAKRLFASIKQGNYVNGIH